MSQSTQRRSSIGTVKSPPASSPLYSVPASSLHTTTIRSPCLSPDRCIAPRAQRVPNATDPQLCEIDIEGPPAPSCPLPRPVQGHTAASFVLAPFQHQHISSEFHSSSSVASSTSSDSENEEQVEGCEPHSLPPRPAHPGLSSPFHTSAYPPYLYSNPNAFTPMAFTDLSLEPPTDLEESVSEEIRSIFTCGLFEQSPRAHPISISTPHSAASAADCCLSPPTRTQNPVVMDLQFATRPFGFAVQGERHELPFMVLESPLLPPDYDSGVHSLAGSMAVPNGVVGSDGVRGVPIPGTQRRRWSETHSVNGWPRLGTSC